ncbi:MAG TPA: hypothetical protein VFJ82_23530 [Longimicrobium sp.]|nr:hypothetical protein [Longimicrobium sp.]
MARPGWLTRFPALTVVASIALFVLGGGTLVYAFATLAYDVPAVETAAAFAAGALVLASSITLAVVTERQLRREEAEQARLAPPPAKQPRRPVARADPNRVLARWTLAPDEWRAYQEGEALEIRRGAGYNVLVGAVFGVGGGWMATGRWPYAAAAAAGMGLVFWLGTLWMAARMRKRVPGAGGAVVLRPTAVEIDGATSTLRDERWWLSGAKVRDDLPLPVIELSMKRATYERGGSRRTFEQVVRVPVPRARAAQAATLVQELRPGRPDRDDDG